PRSYTRSLHDALPIFDQSCEDQVVQQLVDLRRRGAQYAAPDAKRADDEYFYAEQNARLVKNAEEYYRTMFRGRVSSWNLRDSHRSEEHTSELQSRENL